VNAPADPQIFSKAVLADSLARHHASNFATDLRAIAEQIRADAAAGKLVLFHGGLHTRDEIDAAIPVEGGYIMPGSVGGEWPK
jgi:hypothetical protein